MSDTSSKGLLLQEGSNLFRVGVRVEILYGGFQRSRGQDTFDVGTGGNPYHLQRYTLKGREKGFLSQVEPLSSRNVLEIIEGSSLEGVMDSMRELVGENEEVKGEVDKLLKCFSGDFANGWLTHAQGSSLRVSREAEKRFVLVGFGPRGKGRYSTSSDTLGSLNLVNAQGAAVYTMRKD